MTGFAGDKTLLDHLRRFAVVIKLIQLVEPELAAAAADPTEITEALLNFGKPNRGRKRRSRRDTSGLNSRPRFQTKCMMTIMTTSMIELALMASLWCFACPTSPAPGFEGCVPNDVDLSSVVVTEAPPANSKPAAQTTVKQRLTQLKARCKKGKLVDGNGKPIYLYPLVGCWGNPPADYEEVLTRQAEEIQRLKKKYTVIQISCAQGDPRLISQNLP